MLNLLPLFNAIAIIILVIFIVVLIKKNSDLKKYAAKVVNDKIYVIEEQEELIKYLENKVKGSSFDIIKKVTDSKKKYM